MPLSQNTFDENPFSSASELADLIHNRSATSREITELLLARIHDIDSHGFTLNSVLRVDETALEQAARCDDGTTPTGPLSGIPVLIKDNIEVQGLPGTAGSLALVDRPVTEDAPLVQRLRNAGAIILGSTNLSEWANIRSPQSTSGWSAVGGLTANPWKHEHSAGGSSSGSGSAIAAGLAPLAVGTETDGSIICPASLNGCVGIKPTVGSVPTDGVIPISNSQDSPGPMARTVRDAALLLEVLSARTELLSACDDESPIRIGVVREWFTKDDATNILFENSLASLSKHGIQLIDVTVGERDEQAGEDEGTVLFHELVEDLNTYLGHRAGSGVQSLSDVIAFNQAHSESELQYFGQEFFELAASTGGRNEKYHEARKRNLDWAVNQVLSPALNDVDVLISTAYAPAWVSTLGQGDTYESAGWITAAPAVAGWPIGTVPMGLVRGLPVGLGVVARHHDEGNLVRAMARIERALGLGILRPTFTR